ncbi:MAG: hypothetical protein Q7S31_02635 [bacterium]|nr:hypothetical protein [bacterium]
MTKKQQNYQLRLAALAVIFAAVAVLFMQYAKTNSAVGVVAGVQTTR